MLQDIPELAGFDGRRGLIRLPDQQDVPLTPRIRQLIDTAEFRRLARISQLGLVALVYPGATHSRFEHSLGVYRMALLYLRQLADDRAFHEVVTAEDAHKFLVAALLHDLGHWPFCHPIEDMRLPGVPEHELFANSFLLEGEIADILRTEFSIQPRDVVQLLSGKPRDGASRLLASLLSGPIDVDKLDYLARDSLHAGVPYGRNFDQSRLIGSLCINESRDGLAILDKGKTAAEMLVFARYVMFSEVYWHHAVRAASAMLQRAFFLLYRQLDLDQLFRLTEANWIDRLQGVARDGPAHELLDGLFGPQRRLYKRVAQFSFLEHPEVHGLLARQPYPRLVQFAEALSNTLSRRLGRRIAPCEILIDAPPVQREVEFQLQVRYPKEGRFRALGDVSPVVRTLACDQFDNHVKQVRIFSHPGIASAIRELADLPELVRELAKEMTLDV